MTQQIHHMKRIFLLGLMGLLLWPVATEAQPRRFNLSLQAGYQYKFLNPRPFNFALDSLANLAYGTPADEFERIRWTPGPVAAIGFHRRRMTIRLLGNQFVGTSDFLGPDSLGVETQREARIDGWNIGVSLDGQLIPIGDLGGVYVGGAFQVSQINTYLRRAASGETLPEFERVSRRTKPSFSIMLPFRFRPIPRLEFSLEPYFQVFFSPTRFDAFSSALNGEALSKTRSGKLIGEVDHFGTTLQVIFYLLPE
jgi:hypothetical protein